MSHMTYSGRQSALPHDQGGALALCGGELSLAPTMYASWSRNDGQLKCFFLLVSASFLVRREPQLVDAPK
jgi:hypothetical protein